MLDDPVRGALEALGITGSEKGVEQNVIRLEGGIGFEFAAPIAVLVLILEKILTGRFDGRGNAAEQAIDFAEVKLRCGG